ncbi:MAG TPA: glycosyltransferase domain-containing protein [Hyphomicrobiaceae bacterium]|nr:glycosyltransferase domain-containing protein [Hyphomicrobiaceae bacterium]
MRITQFTVNVGGYDHLPKVPPVIGKDVDYIYLTDSGPDAGPPWQTIRVKPEHPDPRYESRRLWIRSVDVLPECDVSLMHGGASQLMVNPVKLVNRYMTDDVQIVVREHPDRTSVKQEVEAVRRFHKDMSKMPQRQYAHYLAAGFPDDRGLSSTGIMIYRHTDEVAEFQRLWWQEVERWLHRCQLSGDYVIWLTGIKVRTVPNKKWNKIIMRRKHKKPRGW